MKYAALVIHYLLGLVFAVFGSNYFLQFMKMDAFSGNAQLFMDVMASTGYMAVVKVCEVVLGLWMLSGFKKHLAYIFYMPVALNIAIYDTCVLGKFGIGHILVLFLVFLMFTEREKYKGLIEA